MSTPSNTVSSTSAFIDMSTYAELEAFLYGGPFSITHFVGTVQKSNWFSLVPTTLRMSQEPAFGSRNVSATINRNGDFLVKLWVRVDMPQIWLPATAGLKADATVRYVSNLAHNLFNRIYLTHNDLVAQEMTSFWLDFNYQFNLEASKRLGYRNMIGQVAKNIVPVAVGLPCGTGSAVSLDIPMWFSVDSGRALPVAALPFNETKINYEFRTLQNIVIVSPGVAAVGTAATYSNVMQYPSTTQQPLMGGVETYGMYGIVHNDERVRLGDAPRDILIHQLQQLQVQAWQNVNSGAAQSFDIRLSHSIVALYFAARNTSIQNSQYLSGAEYSNYTTQPLGQGADPIGFVTLVYENTARLAMDADYFTLMEPYYKAPAIPEETGYHMWSYALSSNSLNPCGSTNYSKLANVSIMYQPSSAAVNAAGAQTGIPLDTNGNPIRWPTNSTVVTDNQIQTWEHILVARNHNIIRIANGSIGFPTL
jgi:hypothetical protein